MTSDCDLLPLYFLKNVCQNIYISRTQSYSEYSYMADNQLYNCY